MKVWVEIVAIDGRRIKTPVREDYEDRRDDDPICTADVVAEGFTYFREGYEELLPARWAKMIYGRLE